MLSPAVSMFVADIPRTCHPRAACKERALRTRMTASPSQASLDDSACRTARSSKKGHEANNDGVSSFVVPAYALAW